MADYTILDDPETARAVNRAARCAVDDGGNRGFNDISKWWLTAPGFSDQECAALADEMLGDTPLDD